MAELNQWGLAFILWVQSVNPSLDAFFKTVNWLQTEEFFLIALPIVWWCIDKRVGASLAFLFLSADYLVRLLKGITGVQRPYQVEPRVRNLDPQNDASFPSAGAMDTLIFWVYLALAFRRRLLWAASLLLVVLLAFTRVYLGVHYPTDVLASILIGAVILVLVSSTRLVERIVTSPRPALWVMAIGWPLVLAAVRLNPETAVTLGAMLGFGAGLLLEEEWIRFEPRGPWWGQALKLLIGLVVGLGIRLAVKPLLPEGDIYTFARYAVIGLWMAAGAPWFFVFARLSEREPRPVLARSVE